MDTALDIIIFIIQVITGFVLLYIAYRLFRFYRTVGFDKRFGPYSVELLEDDSESFFDMVSYYYDKVQNYLSKSLIKIKIFDSYSKKYEKYSYGKRVNAIDDMNYISKKIFIGLLCVFLLLFSCIFRYVHVSLLSILLAFLVGFFALDVYLIIYDRMRKNSIEKDINKAVIIMNNAFKSGYSIMQAIYRVHTQMDGAISEEFRKMYIDITFGLNMEVVFNRFADRVDCVEARYMATSLGVVNRTGGNIIQVFDAVERNATTRQRLKEELSSVSASARAMFKILVCIPIFIIGILLILNPTYFAPLFKTPIGILCLLLSVIIYVLYIIIIRKIIYVEVDL